MQTEWHPVSTLIRLLHSGAASSGSALFAESCRSHYIGCLHMLQNIPADTQRLIFQGKVLQDEKPLKDYGKYAIIVTILQKVT